MKIFGICLIKNEADIIAYSLNRHSEWADKIFVYDNGSTDGTWEIVNELAKTNPKIVPFKQEAKPFRDGLRAEVFNAYKHLANDGDWWCIRCDSDEFYVDDPRTLLPKVKKYHHVVKSLHFEYRLTHEDIEEYTFNKGVSELLNQIKYYHPKQTREIRFVKYRKGLEWPEGNYGFPKHKGIISPLNLRIKHFQYRSPEQIERRIEVRRQATQNGYKFFRRDNVASWKDKLEYRERMILDDNTFKEGFIQDYNKNIWWKMLLLHILHGLKIYP
jgi:hypothetical protein